MEVNNSQQLHLAYCNKNRFLHVSHFLADRQGSSHSQQEIQQEIKHRSSFASIYI